MNIVVKIFFSVMIVNQFMFFYEGKVVMLTLTGEMKICILHVRETVI